MKKHDAISIPPLEQAFNSGFANAAASLSKMTKENMAGKCVRSGTYIPGEDWHELLPRHSQSFVITTDIFGDVTGKSYLFLSPRDVDTLTSQIRDTGSHHEQFREEYLKELDNILSASVITKLSNELGIRLFGDVPIFAGYTSCSCEEIIRDDFVETPNCVYINAGSFVCEGNPELNPLFVWVIDGGLPLPGMNLVSP